MGRLARFIHFYTDEDDGGETEPVWATVSGAIASFATPFAYPLKKLVSQINPVQDLHGYDAPWAGGGNKNLLDLEFTEDSGTVAGMTFTHGESSFTLKGTAASESYKIFNLTNAPTADLNTDYTFSITISGTCPGGLYGISFNNGTTLVRQFRCNTTDATSKTFQIPSSFDNATFTLEGLTSGLVFDCEIKVQFEKGSSKTAFSPYSNICPISGWTGLSGKRDGKNLLDPSTLELGGIDANTGAEIAVQTRVRTGFIFVQPGTYIVSNESNCTMASFVYDASGNFVSSNTTWQNPKVVTVTEPSKLRFLFRVGASTVMTVADVVNPQVEVGSTASTYEAYTSLPITVSWQTEAGTVYDGYIDVVTGVLVATHGVDTYDGSSDESWTVISADNRAYISVPSIKTPPTNSDLAGVLSNEYKEKTYNNIALNKPGITARASITQINVFDTRITSEANWRTFLASNPLQVVYPLAEPIHYTLTPQQIETLIGNNTVFVDCGDVEVTYRES